MSSHELLENFELSGRLHCNRCSRHYDRCVGLLLLVLELCSVLISNL